MNNFDAIYFSKFLRENEEIVVVCHRHLLSILDDVIVWMVIGILLPNFFYYFNSFNLQELLPHFTFEVYIGCIYLFLLYRLFDWYNDVWILTDKGIIDVDWSLVSQNITYLGYHEINGVEIPDQSFIDGIIGRGDICIHLAQKSQEFALREASQPSRVVSYIQEMIDIHASSNDHELHVHDDDSKKPSFELMMETLSEIVEEHLKKKSQFHDDGLPKEAVQKLLKNTLSQPGTIDLRSQENFENSLESQHH